MSINQIKFFVKETDKLSKTWNRIDITGGEALTHPNIYEIIDILSVYKEKSSIRLLTNGFKKNLIKIPSWLTIVDSGKKSVFQNNFNLINKAPIDYQHKGVPCDFLNICGITLNRFGFYALGACGAIDRVFGFNLGIKKLSEVSEERLRSQIVSLCDYCGHSPTPVQEKGSKKFFSPSWLRALATYKAHSFELYGPTFDMLQL